MSDRNRVMLRITVFILTVTITYYMIDTSVKAMGNVLGLY